jgi:cell wall-associated NlpC family hydrolase
MRRFPWHIISWPEGDLRTIHPRGELPLLERPFVLGHYDCWGLVMSYFRQTHGIELHDYRVDYPWWERSIRTIFIRTAGMNAGSVSLMVHRNRVIW